MAQSPAVQDSEESGKNESRKKMMKERKAKTKKSAGNFVFARWSKSTNAPNFNRASAKVAYVIPHLLVRGSQAEAPVVLIEFSTGKCFSSSSSLLHSYTFSARLINRSRFAHFAIGHIRARAIPYWAYYSHFACVSGLRRFRAVVAPEPDAGVTSRHSLLAIRLTPRDPRASHARAPLPPAQPLSSCSCISLVSPRTSKQSDMQRRARTGLDNVSPRAWDGVSFPDTPRAPRCGRRRSVESFCAFRAFGVECCRA